MSFPAPTVPVYRKRQKQNDFVVMGPADVMEPGPITVHLKSRKTKRENIRSVGSIFIVDGVQMRYGYLDHKLDSTTPAVQRPQSTAEPAFTAQSTYTPNPDDFAPDDGSDFNPDFIPEFLAA